MGNTYEKKYSSLLIPLNIFVRFFCNLEHCNIDMSFTNNYVFIASVEALWLEDQFYKVLAIVPMHPAARVHWDMFIE